MKFPTFKLPALLGLVGGQTENVASNYNTDTVALRTALGNAVTDNARARIMLRLTGRIVTVAEPNAGAPVVGDGMTVKILDGTEFIVQGQPVVIDEADGYYLVDLSDYPNTAALWVYLSIDAAGLLVATAYTAAQSTFIALGKPLLGKFATDAISVEAIDDSFATKIKRYDQLGTSSGGGGGGGEVYDDTALWEAFYDLRSRVTTLENNSAEGQPTLLNNDERLDGELAGLAFDLVDVNSLHAITTPGSILLDGTTGNAENRPPAAQMPQTNAGGNEPRGDA